MAESIVNDADELPAPRVDKKDKGKAPMSYLYVLRESLGEVAKVLDFANAKYETLYNFKGIADGKRRMVDAMVRHGWASMEEAKDPESGFSHLAHAACCALMALWFEIRDAHKKASRSPYMPPADAVGRWKENPDGTWAPVPKLPPQGWMETPGPLYQDVLDHVGAFEKPGPV